MIRVSKAAKQLGITRQRMYQLIELGRVQVIELDGMKFVDADKLSPDLVQRHHEKVVNPPKEGDENA